MKRNKRKITSKKSALFSKIMSIEVQVIYMKIDIQKVFSYLSDIVTSVSRLNKTEALINSQWTLASSLRND